MKKKFWHKKAQVVRKELWGRTDTYYICAYLVSRLRNGWGNGNFQVMRYLLKTYYIKKFGGLTFDFWQGQNKFLSVFFLNSCEKLQVGTQINGFCYKRKLNWNWLSAWCVLLAYSYILGLGEMFGFQAYACTLKS